LALAASAAGVAVVRAVAPRLGWVSRPRADRWHQRPTALMGGAGFVPGILLISAWQLAAALPNGPASLFAPAEIPRPLLVLGSVLAGATFLFVAGWLDDRRELRPRTKLLFQLGAASQLVYFGGGVTVTGWPIADAAISYLWLIGVTNAVNLLDNMDGLCAGVVGIIAAAMALIWTGPAPGAAVAAAIAGSCAGFLVHNLPPARIFMGDTGSLPLGFLCAGLTLPGLANDHWGRPEMTGWAGIGLLMACAMLMAVPVLDTALVAITRIWSSRSPMQGGRDHTSHRLARLLASERRSLVFFVFLALATSLTFAWCLRQQSLLITTVAAIFWLSAVLLGNFLAQAEVAARQGPPPLLKALGAWLGRYSFFPLCFDGILVMTLLPAAYYLRFDFRLGPDEAEAIRRSMPILFFCCLGLGLTAGSYAIRWDHAGRVDYVRQAVTSAAGVFLALAVLTLATRFEQGYSRSAYLIFAVLFISAQGAGRRFRDLGAVLTARAAKTLHHRPVVIYGAGKRGKLLAEACGIVPELSGYRIVAFFDDNLALAGKKLDGLSIYSGQVQGRLPRAEEVWLATPTISPSHARGRLPSAWAKLSLRRLVLELETTGI